MKVKGSDNRDEERGAIDRVAQLAFPFVARLQIIGVLKHLELGISRMNLNFGLKSFSDFERSLWVKA